MNNDDKTVAERMAETESNPIIRANGGGLPSANGKTFRCLAVFWSCFSFRNTELWCID